MPGQTARNRAISALGRALTSMRPDLTLSPAGAVADWKDNLLSGTDPQWFQAELEEGDGQELKTKFRAAHSSSALAVNTFGRFKTARGRLSIAGSSSYDVIRFEAKCPAGLNRGRPPNLDLLLRGPSGIIGVESKCTEHLTPHRATFSSAYDEQITDWRRETAWFGLMQALIREPERYCYLDAAQLVKHAFGLGRSFDGQGTKLLYLYWTPRNADEIAELQDHRLEVARFAAEVAGANPSFKAVSYRDLWDEWHGVRSPEWLPNHLHALRSRYDVEI